MKHPPHPRPHPRGRRSRKGVATAAIIALTSGLLAACSSASSSSTPQLVWYINPDSGGQAKVAENCSTKDYTISTQVLPQDAGQQRIQLARRLAAGDTGIDLMSIDPPYTAEFANAGYLAPIPADLQATLKKQSFDGATEAATWGGELVVAPFWSNVQVLWYRKSFTDKVGLDMSKYDACMDAQTHRAKVQSHLQEAERRGVNQTPTFVIGGKMYPGALPYDSFKKLIDDELAKAPATSDSAAKGATPAAATKDTAKAAKAAKAGAK